MAKKTHPEKRRFACGIVVKQLPPVAEILKQYDVDIEAGLFLYKRRPERDKWDIQWNKHSAGLPVSRGGSGYVTVKVAGIGYQVHRMIWKVAHGRDPRGVIDHINGIRDDNRLVNLRDVTPHENMMNAVKGRWTNELARRAEAAKADKAARIEARERELLARLKAKYEHGALLAAGQLPSCINVQTPEPGTDRCP